MNIAQAHNETHKLDLVERSKYSFRAQARTKTRIDNGEPLVDARKLVELGFVLEPFWETPGDLEGECYKPYIASHPGFGLSMRQGAYERLVRAAELLPSAWQIVLKAGFRPYDVQLMVLDTFIQESETRNPDWNDEQHLAYAQTFVADPRIVCPPHVTGGAVDIDIKLRSTGQHVDMGCPPNTDSEIAYLHSDLLTQEQYQNRLTLLGAMLEAGFAPNVNEWWHYQYGETYWAAFYGHESTQYDVIGVQ